MCTDCLYSGLSAGQRHIKGKVAERSHSRTHWSTALSRSPCCPRCLSILQTEQKNTLCFLCSKGHSEGLTELGLNS